MTRNIWAVGRNYAAHAKELGNEIPQEPIIFLKAGSCITEAHSILLPSWLQNIHYEVELALKFNEHLLVDSATVALDLTARSLQANAKKRGEPWTLAKSFPFSCPIGEWKRIETLEHLQNVKISLQVNGLIKQQALTSQMIFPLRELVNYIVKHFPVCPGDVILTGTPEGVGPLMSNAILDGEIESLVKASWQISF